MPSLAPPQETIGPANGDADLEAETTFPNLESAIAGTEIVLLLVARSIWYVTLSIGA